ncbi:bifunctional metallophosphatase/5'-nucleotidase [Deinococcus pimensis]|uniref:bifunctional metallophosphatase/5'-nucleotidase n=1 Tax=Deinococcus pimensis TaxID=309888 RepID=UPI0004878A1B|nr:bifunctional metallophosphatase/5'-nucleotidase [Deinococcus pimensis]
MKRTIALLTAALLGSTLAKPLTITIIHNNDLHAHIDPVTVGRNQYGGYARVATLIRQYRASDVNPLVLSGGDTFQGTLYFNVYEGLADVLFMNYAGYRAMAAGNHEFDLGPRALAEFARAARFPVLAANLDVSAEPLLRDLVRPSTVLTVDGEKIGLVGAVTPDLPIVSSPGPNVRILDLTRSLTAAVEGLRKQGVDKIILLSHLGFPLEQQVARDVPGLDVIVGGHSHTLLGDFPDADFPKSEGPYPTVVQNGADRTLIVSAWEWGKVLGRLRVDFDADGRVTAWEGRPVAVTEGVPEDPTVKAMTETLAVPLAALRAQVVGNTALGLDGARENVRKRETPMANVIADATLAGAKQAGAVLALVNGGGVRASIDPGPITYAEAIAVQPFGNTLDVLDLRGTELRAALEHGVAAWSDGKGQFLHVSRGTRYTFDPTKPAGQRVTDVTVDGRPLDPDATYRVALNNFIANGGDGFDVLKNARGTRVPTGTLDLDLLVAYLKANPTLDTRTEGRITILNEPR